MYSRPTELGERDELEAHDAPGALLDGSRADEGERDGHGLASR